MPSTDKRVDAYIAKSEPFAKPILNHLRAVVHDACPEIQETIKWGFPHFEYHGILCSMAAFKQHCAFNLWKGNLVLQADKKKADAMGQFGRITSIKDVPPKHVLISYLKKAMQLNEGGVKATKAKPGTRKELHVPGYFNDALRSNKKALITFEGFPYSKKKDYVEWVSEAKSEDTRARRIQTSIEWLSEGKSRNWKYERS